MAVTISDFLDLLSCNYTVSYNIFDFMGNSVLKEEKDLSIEEKIFPACGFTARLSCQSGPVCGPVYFSAVLGLFWIAVVTGDDAAGVLIHVLGPIAEYPFAKDQVTRMLTQYAENIPDGMTAPVTRALLRIPVMPALAASQYALMFYYCLKGEKCSVSDIVRMDQTPPDALLPDALPTPEHGAGLFCAMFRFESDLIRAVRDGDLHVLVSMYEDYKKINVEAKTASDPIRHVKNLSIIFLAHNTRAAIEGGILAETAYQLRRHYLRMIEQSETILELATINITSLEDFVTRVHSHRFADCGRSREILHCQEYIRLHIEEKLDLARLASHFHYTVYYFSRKFKEECGISITDYIKEQKTERAKLLLKTTQLSVRKISEQLSFESVNTFCAVFKKCAGISPAAFRSTCGHFQPKNGHPE